MIHKSRIVTKCTTSFNDKRDRKERERAVHTLRGISRLTFMNKFKTLGV